MMKQTFSLLVVVLFVGTVYGQISAYDKLYRTFVAFDDMPLNSSAAVNLGWSRISKACDPQRGIAYSSESGGPTAGSPSVLYFTTGGQIAGFGARIKSDHIPKNQIPKFWIPVEGTQNSYDLSLMFRDPSMLCSGKTDDHVLGTYISINNVFVLPEDSNAATKQGWIEGNCIGEMGIHYSYDLESPGNMTWKTENLLPILPMYGVEDKLIKAILIATPTWQDTYPFGQFEGPFTSSLFCFNWCANTGCTFQSDIWSTFHWLFTDYTKVTCTGARCAI
eukprot:TRINITY_DN2552_c0_g1_i4.p1 TRINITY_DN2552_c0_g1~~TRINITY_DN2552_c0_g1_i4.p1  ORF type:complete len:290 (+),score=40.08 TRINITY_DN2552_c0_g1_i4:40-870(+)